MNPQYRRNKLGFTIFELLIAATITVVIVVLLGTVFGSLTSTAARSNQRIDAFRDARAALQLIERDFSGLVSVKPTAYLAIDGDLSNASGSQARHLCGLISAKNKPAGNPPPVPGDLCAVGYYCGWANNNYQLHRYFRDSVATFGYIKDALAKSSYAGIADLYQLGADDVVAANCWNLTVTAFDENGNVLNPQAYPNGGQTSGTYICDPDAATTNPLPAAIEVSFKAMSANAARTAIASGAAPNIWMAQDETAASAQDKQMYQRLIAPNAYQFRTRISLK